MCQRASEVFGSLDPPLLSVPSSRPHPRACTVLCPVYVLKLEQGYFSQKSAVLPPYVPLLLPHPVPSHSVIANNPWLLSHQSLDGSTAIGAGDIQ